MEAGLLNFLWAIQARSSPWINHGEQRCSAKIRR